MADSLIGFLNQQIQKTNRAQDQQQPQQQQTSTNVTTNVTANFSASSTLPNTSSTSSIVPSHLGPSRQINPDQSQHIYPQRCSAQTCISSLDGLGFTSTLTDSHNTFVGGGATSLSSGNVLPIRGSSIHSISIRNPGESMLLQQQSHTAYPSTQLNTQSNKRINMSSSGIPE